MSLLDNVINSIKNLLNNNQADQGNNVPEPVTQSKPEPVVEKKPEIQVDPEPEVEINPGFKPVADKLAEQKPAQAAVKVVEQVIVDTPVNTSGSINPKLKIPEDSSLKRHFLCNLQANIEAELPPRPTDSTLKRHYDAEVKAKLDSLLS